MKWLRIFCVITNAAAAVLYWLIYADQGRTVALVTASLFTFAAVVWLGAAIIDIKTERYRRETERMYPRCGR